MNSTERNRVFQEEFVPLMDILLVYALKKKRNKPDAEDLVQNCMMRMWESLDTYTPNTKALNWALKIMTNLAIDDSRRKKVRVEEEPLTEEVFEIIDPDPQPGECQDDLPDEILLAMQELDQQSSLAIYLTVVDGLPFRKVASIMELPMGTVGAKVWRGRQKLKTRMQD